jgi:hypothetical protein
VVYVERQSVHVLDLASHAVTTVPFTPPDGAQIDLRFLARISRDAKTLYVRDTSLQSDIWMVRFPKK